MSTAKTNIAVSVLRREQLAIAIAIAIQARVPVLMWGKIGVGKSSIFRQLGALLNFPYVKVLNASTREPSDLLGMPRDNEEGTVYTPPRWAKEATEALKALIVIEEANRVGLNLQHALMGVVLDREVGDYPLGDSVSLVAAMNHPGDSLGACEIDAALANRFLHLSYSPNLAEWCDGIESNWKLPNLPVLPPDWSEKIPLAVGVVTNFLRTKGDEALLHDTPKNSRAASGPWPSQRSWETAIKLLAATYAVKVEPEIVSALIAGCIGASAEKELTQFITNEDLLKPEDVLKNPQGFQLPKRTDQLHALATGIVNVVRGNPTQERYMNAWTAMLTLAHAGHKDLATAVVGDLFSIGKENGYPRPLGLEEFHEILEATGHTFTGQSSQVQ